MEFIIDDPDAVQAFIGSLNRKVVRLRFSVSGEWRPDHTVLAVAGGRPVALADCVLFPEVNAANASLLARPGMGAYAVKALLQLKQLGFATHWQSTLRLPTAATLAISRRHFDSTLDQATWEISNKLIETHGIQAHLRPTPLVVSTTFLAAHGLPRLSRWQEQDRIQLLAIAADPSVGTLSSPAGFDLHGTEIMALAFELLDVPFEIRQHVTRTMLLGLAAAHGHDVSSLVGTHVRPDALSQLFNRLGRYRGRSSSSGLFQFRMIDPAAFTRALRQVVSGDLPSKARGSDPGRIR